MLFKKRLVLAVAVLACGCGSVDFEESAEGAGGSGGESPTIVSDRPLDQPGPTFDDGSVTPLAACVFPLTVTVATDPLPIWPFGCTAPAGLTAGTLRHAVACANQTPGVDTIISTIVGTVQLNSNCGGLTFTDSANWQSSLNFSVRGAPGMTGDLVRVDGAGITVNGISLRLRGNNGQRGVRVMNGTFNLNYGYISEMRDPVDQGGFGAGILVLPGGPLAVPNLTVFKSNISDNKATNPLPTPPPTGGGLYFGGSGKLTIDASLFEGNVASLQGGGIAYAGQNTPVAAGAKITNTTITHNVGSSNSSGISAQSVASQPLIIRNSTISENGGGGIGIGVYTGAFVQVEQSTIADNAGAQVHSYGGTLYMLGSIMRGSGAACGGAVASIAGSSNLWHDGSCPNLSGTPFANASLGVVTNNGGACNGPAHACKTQKPAALSPASNASLFCLSLDQRGSARGGAPCWAGAYEL